MTTTPALTGAERTAAKIGYLSKTDLFQDLTPPELAEIERKITMHTCDRGRVFYLPGETGEVLYILKEGRVQLYRLSAEGRKLVIATLEPGTIFGEMSMIGQGMYDAFAEAAEPCTICVMRRRDVDALIRGKPQIALRLLELVAVRMQELETQLEGISPSAACRSGSPHCCSGSLAIARAKRTYRSDGRRPDSPRPSRYARCLPRDGDDRARQLQK